MTANTSKLVAKVFANENCPFLLVGRRIRVAKFAKVTLILLAVASPSVRGQAFLNTPLKMPALSEFTHSLGQPSAPHHVSCAPVTLDCPEPAARRSNKEKLKSLASRFGQDQKELYSSPFRRSNLKWDALFLAGAASLIATDKRAMGEIDGSHVSLSHGISNAGLYGGSAAIGLIWITSLATHNERVRETGMLSAETIANVIPVYIGLQLLTGRERPNEAMGHGRFEQNNTLGSSFPSGHALVSWGIAAVIAREYPRPWVKWLVYGTATAVSLARFTGRDHFPSDVVVGRSLGYLIGRQIFRRHCDRGLSASCPH